jgi:hypothetical protein
VRGEKEEIIVLRRLLDFCFGVFFWYNKKINKQRRNEIE